MIRAKSQDPLLTRTFGFSPASRSLSTGATPQTTDSRPSELFTAQVQDLAPIDRKILELMRQDSRDPQITLLKNPFVRSEITRGYRTIDEILSLKPEQKNNLLNLSVQKYSDQLRDEKIDPLNLTFHQVNQVLNLASVMVHVDNGSRKIGELFKFTPQKLDNLACPSVKKYGKSLLAEGFKPLKITAAQRNNVINNSEVMSLFDNGTHTIRQLFTLYASESD